MGSNIKLIIVTLFSVLFLLQGCSGGGGGGSSTSGVGGGGSTPGTGGGGSTPGGGNVSNTISKSGLFAIRFVDKNIKVFDYKLSIKRGGVELTDTLLKYISSKKQDDGSIVITLKKVTRDGVSKGLTTLAIGDVITLEAKGYTAQQFVVDANMLQSDATKISLKPIESRQTYNLSDITQGSDSVSARSARGARTVVTDKGVTFETLHSGISLTMPKMTYERLARKISRLPRSNTNTKVYIDMTSIDPRTEHDAAIGDFSYDPAAEPTNERTTTAVEDSSNAGLESVVMADLKMTTDSGDEIHCFDGQYDPKTNTCSGTAMATLKMQIPESQFKKYAQKYNDGDRVVPLYSYNKEKATWVRQVKNGKAIDAELVLTDNDNNQKANAGDVLTLVGKVGHFSYWNGDWSIQRTCLNVPVDLTNAPDASSYVSVKGVDYTGRVFKKYLSSDTTEVKGISAKENSIVSISLIMNDGSVGDSFTYATSAKSSECEDVNTTLVAPIMNKHDVKVIVKSTDGKLLKDATVISAGNRYHYTDTNGSANLTFTYLKDLNKTVYVYYYFDGTTVSAKKQVTQNDATLIFKLNTQESSFHGKVVQSVNGGESVAVADAYVKIYNYDPYYYKSVTTDANGSFEIKLPTALTKSGSTAYITISKYNSEYAFYESYNEKGRVLTPDLGTFILASITHDVRGQVSDTEGNPISNAVVNGSGAIYKYVRSDENGNYHLILRGDVDKNETLQAYMYKDGYHYSKKKYFVTKENGSTTKNFTIDLRKAIIRGRVLTSNGIALSNMRVYWSKDYYNYVTTDENGSFSLETYRGGDGKISVYNPSSHKYLDFNASTKIRDIKVDGVEVGKIYNLENLLAVDSNFTPIINGITIDPNTPLVDVPFVVNVNAYDPDNDAITYKFESYYNYDGVTISMNNNNIATITASSSGYYYFIVTATDSNGNSTQKTVSVYVKNHVRPVIDSVSYVFPHKKSYFDKTAPLDIKVEAHSSEGNSLTYTYSLENLVDGKDVILDDTDSNVTIPKDIANGRYRLIITVSDLYNRTTTSRYITVDNTVAPEIDTLLLNNMSQTSITVKENSRVSFDVNLTDAQHVTGATWYWYINGKTFTTQKIDSISFSKIGYYYGYVTVRDSVGRSDYRSFYVNVQKDAKPVIDSVEVTPSIITKTGTTYVDGHNNSISDLTLNINAHDDDTPSLTYKFGKLGESKAKVSDNNATFSLADLSEGRHAIVVTVSDNTSSVKAYVNIEVLKDTPPVIRELRVPLNAKKGDTIQLQANATDANEEALTYTWSSTAGKLTNATSKIASLKVSVVKDINVTLQVSDGVNTVTRVRVVHILDNIAPEIRYFDLRTLSVTSDNQNIKLKSIYGDVDGHVQSAKYIVINDKNETQFEKTITRSGVITNLALNLAKGDYKVYLKVTDDDNVTTKSARASFTVEAKNSAPKITALTATSENLLVDETTTLNLAANDVDGDALTISWSADGGSVVRDAVSQDKATFSADKAGTYTITAVATDTGGLKAIKTVVITVQNAGLSVKSDKTSYILGDEVTLTATMSSGNTLPSSTSWSVESKPDGSALSTTAHGASISLTPDKVGTYKVKADTTINGIPFSAQYAFSVQEQTTTTPDLEGSVTSDTGDQLSGAKVRLYNKTDATLYDETVTTDGAGAYSFSDVPAGSYYLVVYAGNGYVSQTQVVEISK